MDLNALEICGCVLIGYVSLKAFCFLARITCNSIPCRDHLKKMHKHNDYAVVTGSTDGIGLEYARQLARRGFNILLLSRTEHKLARVAHELREENDSIKVEHLAVDFSKLDIYDTIEQKMLSLDGPVSVLVNNVGVIYHIPEYFHRLPSNVNRDTLITNCVSCTLMTQIVAAFMVKQQRGVIINVSSFCGVTNFPLFATYSATKAFMNSLGASLARELEESNIIVQTATPNQVETKASKDVYSGLMSVKASSFVGFSLNSVGRESMTSAHPWHKWINSTFLLVEGIMGQRFSSHFKLYAAKAMIQQYNEKPD